jgi:hypothetical protein
MFTARQPVNFCAKASIEDGKLMFETSKLLLRFRPLAGHPTFALPQSEMIVPPWKGNEVAPSATARNFVLTLHGPTMNEMTAQNPEHPLYIAFQDQLIHELPINLGPFPPRPGEPPCEGESVLIYTLFLKLSVCVA